MDEKNSNMAMEIEKVGSCSKTTVMRRPKRMSPYQMELRERKMRLRATYAKLKLKADQFRSDFHNRMNITNTARIQQELFFPPKIDLSRMKVSDTPADEIMQSEPAGGSTSPGIIPEGLQDAPR